MIYSYGQTHAIPDTGDKTSVIEYSPNSTNIMFIFFSLFCRFWFNFSVDNVHVDQRIIFNIVNLSKTRNLFTLGLTPIVRSSSRPKWWNSASNVATNQPNQSATTPCAGKGFLRQMCITTSRQSTGSRTRSTLQQMKNDKSLSNNYVLSLSLSLSFVSCIW